MVAPRITGVQTKAWAQTGGRSHASSAKAPPVASAPTTSMMNQEAPSPTSALPRRMPQLGQASTNSVSPRKQRPLPQAGHHPLSARPAAVPAAVLGRWLEPPDVSG